jgi:hypothetical protein
MISTVTIWVKCICAENLCAGLAALLNCLRIPLGYSANQNEKYPLLLVFPEHHCPRFPQEKRQMATDIRSLVEEFVNQIVAAVETDSIRRVQQAVTAAFGAGVIAPRRGRPPRAGVAAVAAAPAKKHRPKQFCPVPGCTGVAAPVFGMVCAKHKDVSKAKIKEYRAQRRASK